ncbi:MAG: transposase [Desulfuromonadaceae bacterium]|nr:transposase [Desulfuromonadaceae bacterium]MDD2856690.1 transposase [Desulfuromonadaceae bacterium]
MTYNSDIHHRRSVRLPEYDYAAAGAYFVTVCVHERECQFGEIVDGVMMLNHAGHIVEAEWIKSGELRSEIVIGEYVVMPNHFHGIVNLNVTGTASRAPTIERFGKPVIGSLPTIVRSFKSAVTKRINIHRATPGCPVWQRNYYEHVIRDDADYKRIAEYITDNPLRWVEDRLHPDKFTIVPTM